MRLSELFHWSPADRYEAISRDGLHPGSSPTVSTQPQQHVCLSTSPRMAWELSAGMDWVGHVDAWDLWVVQLADDDEVRIRPGFGPVVDEVTVHGPIPADRLWWAGRRHTATP